MKNIRKSRVLVAASEIATIRMLAGALRKLGYSPMIATSLYEVAAHANRNKPDAAIVEMSLIASSRDFSQIKLGIPLILLAEGGQSIPARMLAICHGYIDKTFTTRAIGTALELAISRATSEKSLWKSHAWYKSVLSLMGDAVIVADEAGKVVLLNGGAETFTGWQAQKAGGHDLSEVLTLLSPGDHKQLKTTATSLIAEADAGMSAEHLVVRGRTGVEHHVETSTTPVTDTSGKLIGLVIVMRDMAGKHLMTRRILTEQKIKAVGTLTRGIAQDFSTAIHVISGYASSMADSILPETRAHEDAQRIMETARHGAELVNRLISLAQASEPARSDPQAPVELTEVVKTVDGLFHGLFETKKIHFTVKAPPEMPCVKANFGQMLDIFICLLLNSVEAMPDGGTATVQIGTRLIKSPNRRLNPLSRSGNYVVITVSDTGVGIPDHILGSIFQPFFTTKNPDEARGLGLTIVRQTVLGWGGWVAVRSKAGHGASFTLHVPEAKTKKVKLETAVRMGGEMILVLDDRERELSTIRGILEEDGYQVITSKTAEDALAALGEQRSRIQVIVMDVILGATDARQTLEALRAAGPDVAVILMSGFSRDYVRGVIGSGGWGFVQKPIEKDQLLKSVSKAILKDGDHSLTTVKVT